MLAETLNCDTSLAARLKGAWEKNDQLCITDFYAYKFMILNQ